MSWKKELLKGLVEVKGELARQQSVIAVYDSTVQRQQAVIEKLLDRIQSKDLKELKTYESLVPATLEKEFYNPEEDESNIGMAIPVEEKPGG